MKLTDPAAARRLDHLIRSDALRMGALLTGLIMIALGALAIFMTLRYTPDQLNTLVTGNPKLLSQSFFEFMPAPIIFRKLGIVLVCFGIVLASIARGRKRDVNATPRSRIRAFFSRPLVQRTNLLVMALLVLQYVAFATVMLRQATRNVWQGTLIAVWILGAIAILLIVRAWRAVKSRPEGSNGV